MAHDLFLRGRWFLSRRNAASLEVAIRSFTRAIARDSGYAPAYAGLATAYAMSAPFAGRRPHEVFPLARAAAERALSLDSTAADAHMARAVIAMFYDWDWKTAAAEFERSIALNPSDAEARLFYAWYLVTRHRMADARAQLDTATALDPLSVIITARVGTLAWFEGRYADAETQFRKALELDPTFYLARTELPTVLMSQGKREAARAALPLPEDVQPGTSESGWPAGVRVALGDTAGARRSLAALTDLASRRYVSPDVMAIVMVALGDYPGALDQLDRAVEEHSFTVIFVGTYPPFRALAGDPRFQRVLATIGLPPGR
jgi:tetratricopeptide (TPR) repeat protein